MNLRLQKEWKTLESGFENRLYLLFQTIEHNETKQNIIKLYDSLQMLTLVP